MQQHIRNVYLIRAVVESGRFWHRQCAVLIQSLAIFGGTIMCCWQYCNGCKWRKKAQEGQFLQDYTDTGPITNTAKYYVTAGTLLHNYGHTHTYTHIYTHTYTHTYTYTYTHTYGTFFPLYMPSAYATNYIHYFFFHLWLVRKHHNWMGWSPGMWLMEETCNQKVVSSNPGAGNWMDIFSHLFVVRIVMFCWKDKNKRKRGRGWPIF